MMQMFFFVACVLSVVFGRFMCAALVVDDVFVAFLLLLCSLLFLLSLCFCYSWFFCSC